MRNERTKLLATGLNNIGIAVVVAGAIAPLIARSYGAPGAADLVLAVVLGIVYFGSGAGLMMFARLLLGELVE